MLVDLIKEADQLAFDAEKQNKMGLLVKSNALRSKAKEKTMELEAEKQRGPKFTKQAQGFIELITWYIGLMTK